MSAAGAYAQTGLATVTGTLTDSSGAVVANAPIELRNTETGQLFKGASSETGNYTVSQIPVGDYDLTITVPGFKTYTHRRFHLAAQQTLREDVALEVGAAAESVTVTTESSLLKTESSELVHNVTVSQMNNLPILPVGSTGAGFRDPFSLVRLIPGTSYTAGSVMVVNGNPDDTVQIRVDGQTAGNTGFLRGTTQQTQPSADAIEEVAVQTSNYAAEFGTAGGGVMNVVMKSGSNQFHGTGYDYVVNEALNAHQPYTGIRNAQRRQDWGLTIGGPVWVPKFYDGRNKTFFFFSYEQYRENTIAVNNAITVPIPAYRNGDFSQVIVADNNRPVRVGSGAAAANYVDPLGRPVISGMLFDPQTTRSAPGGGTVRDQFPGNIIPVARFDPISVKVLSLVPLPVGPNHDRGQYGNNYQNPFPSNRVSTIPSIKVDQVIGAKGRVSFYTQETRTRVPLALGPNQGDGFPSTITQSRGSFISATTARLNYDYTATPTLLLHFGLGWSDLDFSDRAPQTNYDAFKELGLRGQTLSRLFPALSIGSQSVAVGGMSSIGPTIQGNQYERRPAGNVSMSWVKGSHTIKAGAEYRLEKYPDYNFSNTAGLYTFGANATQQTSLQGLNTSQGFHGMNFASFMLGGLSAAQLDAPLAASLSKSQTSLFLQDNWKVTRKLTLDYGLRWDYGTYAREHYGRYANFSMTVPNPSAGGRPGGRIYEATCNCNFANNYPYAIGPRIGVAYQINKKTVVRTGIGVVYSYTQTTGGSSVRSANAGTPGFGMTVGQFADGIPAHVRPVWPNFAPNAGQPDGTVVTAPTYLDINAGRPPRQVQWSVTLQREIHRNLVVEGAYVGNQGVWWPHSTTGLTAINVLKESDLTSRGFTDFTSLAESNLLTTPIANLTATQRATLAARGINLPYANFPTTLTARQSLLPFPQYTGSLVPTAAPLGKTWYNGFQLNVTQRFNRGLTFNVNYTWSKTLDLMDSADIFNRQLGKNLSSTDIPQQFRMSAEYQVPRLKNSTLPVLSNKVVSYILGDWGIGWYLQYQSAAVLARPSNQGTVPISNFLGRGPGSAQLKIGPDGKPMNPWSVDWVDYSGQRRTDPIDINCHCFDPTTTVVFNPNAWESIPNGQWAASLSDIRYFRGFRQPQESLNFSRNFRIKERVLLHFRVEFQNAFNRMRLPVPTGGNFSSTPTRFTTGPNTGLYSGGFGTVLTTSGLTGQRAGTMIARITF